MRVLVTGSTGFVGGHLLAHLGQIGGVEPWGAVRTGQPSLPFPTIVTGEVGQDDPPSLSGFDAVVHCAARVHVMQDHSADPLQEFRKVNVAGTVALAERAARDGVKRFVFLSSVKVNGEGTALGRPYRPDDEPAPVDPYGVSKAEAEAALQEVARRTGLELVIIRPVLVYGPGVKGNFLSLLNWLDKGIPLPLAGISNRRSMVSVANLCDLIATCVTHDRAPGQTFFASDVQSLSTTDLLTQLARQLDRRSHLFAVPGGILKGAATLAGRKGQYDRLFGTLEVDIAANLHQLGWTPPQSTADGLRDTALWFQKRHAVS